MNKNILENKEIVEVLKKVSMKEFEVYLNNYMGNNLQVGEKYDYNGRDSFHYIVVENMKKGFREMCSNYNIDYAIMYETFKISTWDMVLNINVDLVSVWERIGQYHFKTKTRKNASYSNTQFTLLEIPYFRFYEENIMSVYDFVIDMLEKKKTRMVAHYKGEIESHKKQIEDLEKSIEDIERIDFNEVETKK